MIAGTRSCYIIPENRYAYQVLPASTIGIPPPTCSSFSSLGQYVQSTKTTATPPPLRLLSPSLSTSPQNYKTQLCKHFLNDQKCRWGNLCNYAHGYDELELTTLKERHDAGLLDANVYRNKPCMMHIATGSW